MASPRTRALAARATSAPLDAVLGNQDLLGAITALVPDDDLLAWVLVCRATRKAQMAGGRALVSGVEACAGSVERAAWAVGLGVPIEELQRAAACVGSVAVLRWSVEEAGHPIDAEGYQGRLLCMRAARAGSEEALAYLRKQGCVLDGYTCRGSAKEGHLSVLQWLRSQDPPCPWDGSTCWMAARKGHLSILQWLRSQDPPCPWDSMTCSAAAGIGTLTVLQWLRSQDPPCPWDSMTCSAAARQGNLSVLQWLRSQDPPCPWNARTCAEAARQGNLSALQWARSQDPPCPWDASTWQAATSGSEARSEEQRQRVIAWLRAADCPVAEEHWRYEESDDD